jgi:hypothetical protein
MKINGAIPTGLGESMHNISRKVELIRLDIHHSAVHHTRSTPQCKPVQHIGSIRQVRGIRVGPGRSALAHRDTQALRGLLSSKRDQLVAPLSVPEKCNIIS